MVSFFLNPKNPFVGFANSFFGHQVAKIHPKKKNTDLLT
jgi:hypothetical protein